MNQSASNTLVRLITISIYIDIYFFVIPIGSSCHFKKCRLVFRGTWDNEGGKT